MAVIRKGSQDIILRQITGKLGNVVIQHRHGKTIIYSKRKRTVVSQTIKSLTSRKRFRSATMFAVFLNKIPALSAIWKAAKIQGTSGYTRIMKYNAAVCDPEGPTINNLITPPVFHFRIKDVILHEDQIGIIMEDWFQTDVNDNCVMIMVVYDPVKPGNDKFIMTNLSPLSSMDFTITLDELKLRKCKEYKSFILYTAIYRQKGNEVQWSNTVAVKGELDSELLKDE